MKQGNDVSPEVWAQVLEQFEKIKSESGIEPELDYIKQLEDMLGMSVEEMNRETEITLRTKRLGVELIHEDAKFPSYAYPSDSGFDLYSTIDYKLSAFGRALIPTGLFIQLPQNCEAQIRPRSGLAFKKGVTVLNSPGTIDADYRGEIGVLLVNLSSQDFLVEDGERVAQMVVAEFKQITWNESEELENTDRGAGGFGSTGVK